MRDANARRPVLWLNEERLADRAATILLVRVPVEHKVDSRNFAGDPRRDILARHARGQSVIARGLIEARVHGYEHDVRASRASLLNGLFHRGHYVAKAQAPFDVLGIPQRDAGRRRAHDPNFQTRTLDDRPRTICVYSLGIEPVSVGGKKREFCLPHS